MRRALKAHLDGSRLELAVVQEARPYEIWLYLPHHLALHRCKRQKVRTQSGCALRTFHIPLSRCL